MRAYQFLDESSESDKVLLDCEMELIPVLDICGN